MSAAGLGQDPGLWALAFVTPGSSVVFATVGAGIGTSYPWWVAPAAAVATGTPAWRPIFGSADSVAVVVPHDPDLYVLTRRGTPHILRTRLAAPDLATAETIYVQGKETLQTMSAALDGLYVQVFSQGVNGIIRIPWGGNPARIGLPPGTSIVEGDLESEVQTDALRPGAFLVLSSWTQTSRPYRYDPATDRLTPLPLRPAGAYDRLDGYVAETLYARSHDGVRVPLTILRPQEFAHDGSLAVLLTAYGAYGEVDVPGYGADARPWYAAGGVIATCHVRGGGYYGEDWHEAGRAAAKPNTWLDFIACAEHLVREGYTRPERLVVGGGSAGGITVGRAITERPDLFAAAIISNGTLDMVRNEKGPVGAANVPEFGSVTTEEGFRGLITMSAYHHVRPGTAYPAVLIMTGLNDARVPPWHSAKMAAALQAATSSDRPVLLRVDTAAGHESGAVAQEQRLLRSADVFGFAMAQVGLLP